MKSIYCAPTCNTISLQPSALLALSDSDSNLKSHNYTKIEDEPQLSGKRAPFGNGIWANMEK